MKSQIIANSKKPTFFSSFSLNFKQVGEGFFLETGRKDLNNQNISEGDILREYSNDPSEYADYLIHYNSDKSAFVADLICEEGIYEPFYLETFESDNVEIIGHYTKDARFKNVKVSDSSASCQSS